MSDTRFIPRAELDAFLGFLLDLGLEVLVPADKPATAKPSVVFTPYAKGMKYTLAKATVSPKEAVLPECETLLTFKKRFGPEGPEHSWLEVEAETPATSRIVFGCRPCDARGFTALDRPFMQGLFKDPYYQKKREKLLVCAYTCNTGCATCFCHWVGGGPTSPIGSDILMTEIADGFVLQAITEKGRALLARTSLEENEDKFREVEEVRKKAWQSLVPAPDISGGPESLKNLFEDEEFWIAQTAKCISCGACTYFCPTCYCFNITDEGDITRGGRRLRSWDNCMSSLYTREASGHNPRAKKFQRMRNRVSHKFWTYPENWGDLLCSGCGRCIANCPVYLDIREIVLAAIETDTARKQGAANGK